MGWQEIHLRNRLHAYAEWEYLDELEPAGQGADRFLDSYDLGIDPFLIRGFDAVEYGRDLIPLVLASVAECDAAREAAE